jgi:acetyl-CoA carboxylase / biotin carboxylase 1
MAQANGHHASNGTNGTNGTSSRVIPVTNGRASYAEKHKLADHFIGGNRLENAPSSKVKDFVANHDGHTVITNVCASLAARICDIRE